MKKINFINEYLNHPIYDISQEEKSRLLLNELNYLTKYHYENCEEYASFVKKLSNHKSIKSIKDIPFFLLEHSRSLI